MTLVSTSVLTRLQVAELPNVDIRRGYAHPSSAPEGYGHFLRHLLAKRCLCCGQAGRLNCCIDCSTAQLDPERRWPHRTGCRFSRGSVAAREVEA